MKRILALFPALIVAALAAVSGSAAAQERIGSVDTSWRLMGSNDQVTIDRYDDPKVENSACYVSRAVTGGAMASIGLGEDPSRFSIACRAIGPVKIVGEIDRSQSGEVVFNENTSPFFKEMRISRFYDAKKNVIVYLVWSTKLIDGSPFNSISVVPLTQ